MAESRRVVVTGLGLVSPVGLDEKTFWGNMLAGRHSIRRLSVLDPTQFKSPNGATVDDQIFSEALEKRSIRPFDRALDMAMLASTCALESGGIECAAEPPRRNMAVITGTGGGVVGNVAESFNRFAEKGLRGVRPTTVIRIINNSISSMISIRFRLTGPNYAVTSACTSALNAIGIGFRMIRDGYIDCALCGGTDAMFIPAIYGAWDRIGAMSENPDPEKASRPFDRDRDGFVLGEGAGMILMETNESAKARGARVRGEIAGYGESSDATHIAKPDKDGQIIALKAALADAQTRPSEIGYINAHGTGTTANDESESQAIREVFGSSADQVLVGSNKSLFGHLMGASGAVETIATIMGLEAGRVPPNLNLDNPDPACNLRFVSGTATDISSPLALKNSFGFGGNNAVMVLRRYEI